MLTPKGEVVTVRIVEDIHGLVEKEDSEKQKQIAEAVEKVITSDDEGHRKVQIAIPKVTKAVDEVVAQKYEIVEHNLGRITDDMECEEIQEGMVSIRERLTKANERIVKLEAENKSLVAIRDKFRTFEGECKDFLTVKDLAIPRLRAFIEPPERYLERTKLVDEGEMSTVESWYVALTIRLRILEEIQNEIAQHSPGIDTSISTMLGDVGVALDFEDIKEENVNEIEFVSRLDELGKVAIKKKYLGTLASLSAFIGYAKHYEKDHEKTLQAASNMMNSAELKMKHMPCPPMKEVNNRLAKFIALAKKMKEKGRIILEDHLV